MSIVFIFVQRLVTVDRYVFKTTRTSTIIFSWGHENKIHNYIDAPNRTISCNQKTYVDDSLTEDNWFVTEFRPLCDNSQGIFLDINKLNKHRQLYPYDTVQVVNNDSVTISFDFITDCCRNFSGDVDLRQDTLFLKYGPSNDTTICDCYCDYRMTYKFAKGDRNWKGVKIINEEVGVD